MRGSLACVSQTKLRSTYSCLVKGVAHTLLLVLRDLIPAPGAQGTPTPCYSHVLCLSPQPGEPG